MLGCYGTLEAEKSDRTTSPRVFHIRPWIQAPD